MKVRAVVATLIGVCLILTFLGCQGGETGPSPSFDVTGHWSGTVQGGNAITMDLVQTSRDVMGTSTGGGETGQVSGSVDSDKFSFSITWPSGSTTIGSGTINGNSITGTFSENGDSGTFTLTRQ